MEEWTGAPVPFAERVGAAAPGQVVDQAAMVNQAPFGRPVEPEV